MATNPLFDNFNNVGEQELLEDLVVESIKIYGQDMYYLPRRRVNFDKLYYEDDSSSFDTVYPIEVYVKEARGFGNGENNFLGKFGAFEIRDQVILTVARRTFTLEVTRNETDILRPREGDLLYFPLNKKLFIITFTDDKPFFYQLGDLQMYDMTCELFAYSMETMSTGIPEIDSLQKQHSVDIFDYSILTEDGFRIKTEEGDYLVTSKLEDNIEEFDPLANNLEIAQTVVSDDIIDFSEQNPFAETRRY
jgi:hypothetical protein